MYSRFGKDRSDALAQQALTWLAKIGIAPNPIHFEVAFSYTAGTHAELTGAVNEILAKGNPEPGQFAELHERFFGRNLKTDSILELGAKMAAELDSVLKVLETAGEDQTSFGRTLTTASAELGGGNVSPGALKAMIDQVVTATRAMGERSQMLEQQLQVSSREVAELHQRLEAVKRESLTDQLTGIANRKAFDIEFQKSIQRAIDSKEPLSLLMCDIDHFKKFNDTFGHRAGDQVLRLVGSCLSENVKGRDTAARYGGEEFAILLPATPLSASLKLADQIRVAVESKKLIKKSTGDILSTITISIGVSQFLPGENSEEFIRRADTCLYAAKRTGRNRVVSENDRTALASADIKAA